MLNPWIPQAKKDGLSNKQAAFLAYTGREAMYGGAAGGGKSVALLMAALQHVEDPAYHALILRRTYKQLAKADSIMATSHEWLAGKARWNGDDYKWTFPSGATLEFGHMENEKAVYNYQGASWHFVAYDELTQFVETMYTYLFSRQRRQVGVQIPIRMRAASNPGGVGHHWVKKRFVEAGSCNPNRQFIPAKLTDNANIDQADYVRSLDELDPVTKAQLLAGDWDALPSGRFRRDTLDRFRYQIVNKQFDQGGEYVYGSRRCLCSNCWVFLTVDPAATAEGVRKRGDPDYTVISVWAVTPDRCLLWIDCIRFRLEIPDIVPQIQAVYGQYRPHFVGIEAVASNRGVLQLAMRTGMVVREVSPRGLDKLVRATPAMVLSESGRLWLPADRTHWLDEVITELLLFSGSGETHDDIVDTCSYACALMDEFQSDDARPFVLTGRAW